MVSGVKCRVFAAREDLVLGQLGIAAQYCWGCVLRHIGAAADLHSFFGSVLLLKQTEELLEESLELMRGGSTRERVNERFESD